MNPLRAEQRVAWTLEHFPGRVVLTSSFGAQSAVCLHMVTRQQPDIPVVLVDTGYLFPETYRFIDELSERLALNLHIYRPTHSAAWAGSPRRQKVGNSDRQGHRTRQRTQQGRADAAGAARAGRGRLDFRPAAATGQKPPEHRGAGVAATAAGCSIRCIESDRLRCPPVI
ncbi:MAG: phosphoadenosine phosphosulfate reductase family protein [Candidatus Competibacteraceae bacterium]|nr:phosphoadenosine phosphosulfate reductase family protein [Candidatus Competibacteraceae bacterium]